MKPEKASEENALSEEQQQKLEEAVMEEVANNPEGVMEIPDWTPEMKQKMKLLVEGILKGELYFKNILKFSDRHLDIIYSEAYNMYTAGKYEKAETAFRGLLFLDPKQAKYYLGLGACLQMQKRYVDALELYSLGIIQDPIFPKLYYHAAECHFALGKPEYAVKMLEGAIEAAKANPQYAAVGQRATSMMALVKKHMEHNGIKMDLPETPPNPEM